MKEEQRISLLLPKTVGAQKCDCFTGSFATVPALGSFSLKNGIATSLGGNLDSFGRLICSNIRPVDGKKPEEHDLFNFTSKRFFPKMERHEKVVSLTLGWQDMFYHWMYEVLPRLVFIKDLDCKIYIDQGKRFQRESLKLAGIDQSRIIDASKVQGVYAKELIVPPYPPMPTPWVCHFLRTLNVKPIDKRRKLYLSRRDADKRRILNEDELWPILEREGFELATTSGLPFAEQMALFASAEIVVAPHGAGLSHLAFCEKGTPVLELFAPVYTHRCYWEVASAAELRYHYLFGESEAAEDPDFTVDPMLFEKALLHALADRQ
ncbi:MAG: hypothetical protein S4CHLAM81_09450 [Chlamydiales bacterium]|nr:hypothetical protein [Chlamydiales bacterium]MCH9635724.1 hypothetical protein [Chlamydiales bacterium]MCH9704166.1 glycosyltransferase family 61 protein [Chlamydiota bacterium]